MDLKALGFKIIEKIKKDPFGYQAYEDYYGIMRTMLPVDKSEAVAGLKWLSETIGKETQNMEYYGVIMAGGGGTRFWPLSRQETPKQLINLSGKDLMVNEAIDRMNTVIDRNHIYVITSELQAPSMAIATKEKIPFRNILSEPIISAGICSIEP